MTAKTTTKGLHAKLAEVMAGADRIPKNGTYSGQGSFKYVLVGDAADAIRKALGERGVSMLPSAVEVVSEAEHATKSGGTMTTITIRTTWTLVDGESGETATIQSIGTGADAGDKASPKAQTNAMKYALLMGFLLSTGDDPEQSDSSDRRSRSVARDEEDADDNATGQTRTVAEEIEFLGKLKKTGSIQKGGAAQYQGQFHQTTEGHVFGFRLKLAGEDKDIPQVLVTGSYGEGLWLAYAGETAGLIGAHVTVKGRLYNVRPTGRRSYYRLVIGEAENDMIETPVVRIPPAATEPPAETPEAPSEPLPFDMAAVDAEKLDPEERLLIAGGLP